MKTLLSLVVVFGMIGGVLYSQEGSNDVATLKATIEELRRENARLRE